MLGSKRSRREKAVLCSSPVSPGFPTLEKSPCKGHEDPVQPKVNTFLKENTVKKYWGKKKKAMLKY